MSLDSLTVLAGGHGSQIIHDTTDMTDKKYVLMLVTEDAVFSNLEESTIDWRGTVTAGVDVLTTDEQNIASGSTIVKAGTVLKAKRHIFSRVKLQSGQINAFYRN